MKRISAFFALALFGIVLASCSKGRVGDIRVNDYRIEEIKPENMRNFECTLSLDITNNGRAITFPEFEGEVFRDEQKVGDFTLLEPFVICGDSTAWTKMRVKLVVPPSVSLLSIMGMLNNFDISRMYVSFDTKVKLGGLKFPFKRNRLPLSKLIKQEIIKR